MPTKMKAAPKKQEAPVEDKAPVEDPQDVHSAEIERETVVELDDEVELANILRLKGDPFRFVIKAAGESTETGAKDFHYAFVDESDIPDRLEIRFEFFDDDRIVAPAQSPESRKRDGIVVKGQKGMRIPMRRWKAWQKLEQQDVDDDLGSANLQAQFADEIDSKNVRATPREGLQYQKSGL